jgi:hypothetical protein
MSNDKQDKQGKKKRAERKLHVAPRCTVIIRKCPPTPEQIEGLAAFYNMLWDQAMERVRQESAAGGQEPAGGDEPQR